MRRGVGRSRARATRRRCARPSTSRARTPRSSIERAERLADLADDLVEEIEFGFLFDRERQLFSIGYNVADGRLDSSYYDMLASEARLASFVAIATARFRRSTGSSSDAR